MAEIFTPHYKERISCTEVKFYGDFNGFGNNYRSYESATKEIEEKGFSYNSERSVYETDNRGNKKGVI